MKNEQVQKAILDELYKDISQDKDNLFEMSSLSSRETGLKTKLNLMQQDDDNEWPHWIRVKVKLNDGTFFPILVDPKVEPLNSSGQYNNLKFDDKALVKEAVKYTKKIKKVVKAYWEGKFDEATLHDIINGRISLEDAIKNNS